METNIRNKCKAFTSLEQSKILAGILPITTIDLAWNVFSDGSTRVLPMDDWEVGENAKHGVDIIPCWSLAALIESITKVQQGGIFYNLTYDFILNKWTMNIEADNWREDVGLYDNPLDAVFEMILKLHKLNLL